MKKFTLQRMRRQRHHTIETEPEQNVKDAIINVLNDNNKVAKLTVSRVVDAGMTSYFLFPLIWISSYKRNPSYKMKSNA